MDLSREPQAIARAAAEERHARPPVGDVHKAYQERIVRTSVSAGFRADHRALGDCRAVLDRLRDMAGQSVQVESADAA